MADVYVPDQAEAVWWLLAELAHAGRELAAERQRRRELERELWRLQRAAGAGPPRRTPPARRVAVPASLAQLRGPVKVGFAGS